MSPDCELVRAAVSVLADGEAPDGITAAAATAHVEGCHECRSFEDTIVGARQVLRFETLGEVPDVAPAVLAAIARSDRGRRRRGRPAWLAVAAAAVVGAVAGATFVGIDREPASIAAADLPSLVMEVQHGIRSLTATIEVVEDNGRTYSGTIAYRAPESMAILLADADGIPLATVVDDARWWTHGARRCSPPTPEPCGPPLLRVVERREPFAEAAPVPLDLVAPVDALALAAPPAALGTGEIAGRRAVGITVPASQVAALLAGLDPAGSLRPAHPTDPVELWLDGEHLVPLALEVRAGDGPERRRWAAAQGYDDEAGELLLAVTLSEVRINGDVPDDSFPPPPPGAANVTDGGFETVADLDAPAPTDLPAGLRSHRRGQLAAGGPAVVVQTWSDGRAWLAVRSTTAWPGGRLFGGLGEAVRTMDLGRAGTGYVDDTGTRVGLHADGLDVVVTGSLGIDDLRRVAASLGVAGLPVPPDWAEATTASIRDAVAVAPGLLVPADVDGFGPPAVRVDGDTITMVLTGAGDRSFRLIRTTLTRLPPPLDPDVVGVAVRGTDGRYRPSTGDLEWLEDGVVHSLRGGSLSLSELLGIAEDLDVAR